MSKETHVNIKETVMSYAWARHIRNVKRDIYICQKRQIYLSKETHETTKETVKS